MIEEPTHLDFARGPLDLTSDAGYSAFLDIVQGADVVLEGFGPGVAEWAPRGLESRRRFRPREFAARDRGAPVRAK